MEAEHGRLDLLVNNAGGAWRGQFGDAGWENVHRHMELNFDAVVRLTEALLPLLRRSTPSAIVNVASAAGAHLARELRRLLGEQVRAGRVERRAAPRGAQARRARRPRAAWLRRDGGFSAARAARARATRCLLSTPERVADAIIDAGPGGRAERYVPRPYWVIAALRILAPRLIRRATGGGALTPATSGDEPPSHPRPQ